MIFTMSFTVFVAICCEQPAHTAQRAIGIPKLAYNVQQRLDCGLSRSKPPIEKPLTLHTADAILFLFLARDCVRGYRYRTQNRMREKEINGLIMFRISSSQN